LLTPLAGKTMTVGQLVQEVDKITVLYRTRGYPLSFAVLQAQTFAQGHVVVTVVEGHVGSVKVVGDIGYAADRLRTLAQPMMSERPLTQVTLERQLNLMRMVPGVTITPALDLPKRADGASELVLTATRRWYTANAGVSDLGTGNQPLVSAGTNSLTPLGEQVKLTSSIPINTDKAKFYAGEATVPVGSSGLAVKVDGYHYDAKPRDQSVQQLGFNRELKNDHVGLTASYPILLNNHQSLTGVAGLYASNARDQYSQIGGSNFLEQRTNVRALTTGLHYVQVGETRSTDINVNISHGLNALGASKSIDSNYGYSAQPNVNLKFTKGTFDVKQSFALPAKLGLVLSTGGQWSDDILPSSEQVSFGTYRYAMGYPQGEISGDKGIGASIELNRKFATGFEYVSSVLPYVMVDYARAYYNQRNPSIPTTPPLASFALGLRLSDDKRYLIDLNVAKPFGAPVIDGDNDTNRNWRFNANYSLFYNAF
jgi:hemolysin activation/secretion protein